MTSVIARRCPQPLLRLRSSQVRELVYHYSICMVFDRVGCCDSAERVIKVNDSLGCRMQTYRSPLRQMG